MTWQPAGTLSNRRPLGYQGSRRHIRDIHRRRFARPDLQLITFFLKFLTEEQVCTKIQKRNYLELEMN